MGPKNPKTKARNTAVSVPTIVKPMVNTESAFSSGRLAKRNSVVSMPKVSMTRISAT